MYVCACAVAEVAKADSQKAVGTHEPNEMKGAKVEGEGAVLPCPDCGDYEDPDPECVICGGRGTVAPRVKRKLPAQLEKYFEKRK